MTIRWHIVAPILICMGISACQPMNPLAFNNPASLSPTGEERVYILRGKLSSSASFDVLNRTKHCLIMIPGISSGNLEEQIHFLRQLRLKSGADLAIFHEWGYTDPTRKIASPMATANAGEDLTVLCKRIWVANPQGVTIDLLAHSAGTIIVNKTALELRKEQSTVRFRHVLFIGTPHDVDVDLDALKERSQAILNICSSFDKINRNISGEFGWIQALDKKPYWNLRMDTSLGGRRIRHYAFLENTPENWLQYGHFLRSGGWPSPQKISDEADCHPETLYRIASWIKSVPVTASQQDKVAVLARECVSHPDREVRYYGVLLMGILRDSSCRALLKSTLEKSGTPPYLRREIYQALGSMADPDDLHYLQQARKSDPASGDVLRDVLRDWKIERIRPATRK